MKTWKRKWKERELLKLRRDWANCKKCGLCEERQNIVFGTGNPDADIMFIGEAPGEQEDAEGEPFVGPSGHILRSMWAALDQDWDDLYVTNLVCCRPPENRDPIKDEKEPCSVRLHRQIYIVDPYFIVALGKQPLQSLVGGRDLSLAENHGELMSPGASIKGLVFPRTDDDRVVHTLSYPVVPIYHPAYILRKDSYDEKTDTFQAGGIADQTFADLEEIVIRLRRIRREYDTVKPAISRRREP